MDIVATMITPYCRNGGIDYDAALKYVEWYHKNGLDGVFSVCQSSEIFFLTLEERIKLNAKVYEYAKKLERKSGRRFTVFSSGHVSDKPDRQAEELNAIYDAGTDVLVLITNRLDPNNEGDDVFISNAENLLKRLPPSAKLGLYECPYPYKRLVTEKILRWCLNTERFYFIKDTCCDLKTIKERCRILNGSQIKLMNANCQTLLDSVLYGAGGYCGVMCNFHPKLYAWLAQNYKEKPETARFIQSVIGTFGFMENGLPYPLSAKYNMNLCGIPSENTARNIEPEKLTEYARKCVEQMKYASDRLENFLNI